MSGGERKGTGSPIDEIQGRKGKGEKGAKRNEIPRKRRKKIDLEAG